MLGTAPDDIRAALAIHCVYRADKKQLTIRATITDTTPGIVAALLADPRTDGDTSNKPADPFDESNTAAMAAGTSNVSAGIA